MWSTFNLAAILLRRRWRSQTSWKNINHNLHQEKFKESYKSWMSFKWSIWQHKTSWCAWSFIPEMKALSVSLKHLKKKRSDISDNLVLLIKSSICINLAHGCFVFLSHDQKLSANGLCPRNNLFGDNQNGDALMQTELSCRFNAWCICHAQHLKIRHLPNMSEDISNFKWQKKWENFQDCWWNQPWDTVVCFQMWNMT